MVYPWCSWSGQTERFASGWAYGCGIKAGRRSMSWRSSCSSLPVFFFSSRRRHTRFDCDWSSDVCSSDLPAAAALAAVRRTQRQLEEMRSALDQMAIHTLHKLEGRQADMAFHAALLAATAKDRKSVV